MTQSVQDSRKAVFDVENVGGIDQTSVEIPPGVTVLTGKNATNRTSFLQSIMAAMGSTNVSIKGDADEARVELTYDGETYERTLTRAGTETVEKNGSGYLEDPSVADLFSFLLETNEARQAVAVGDDLRELIMRPVDTDEITAEIERVEREKGELNEEIAALESLKRELPNLEQRRSRLRDEIEETEAELAEVEEQIDESGRDVEETRQEQEKLESKLDELRECRADLRSVRSDIDRQQESIDALRSERTELSDELEEAEADDGDDVAGIDARIDRLREEKRQLNSETNDLQSVINFNEQMLAGGNDTVVDAVQSDGAGTTEDGGDITEQLLSDDDSITCWTCGTGVDSADIERTLDQLRDLRKQKLNEVSGLEDELAELKSKQRERQQRQQRIRSVQQKLDDVEREIETRESRLEDLREDRSDLTDEVEALEAEVEDLRTEDFGDILDLHKEANQLQFELDEKESELESLTEEIESKEEQIVAEDELREERDELVDELTDLRTRIDQIESEAVEQFNEHMEEVLDILGYDNISRIWIERIETTVREGRKKVDKTVFELHVVRSTESGAAYEDTVDHLSESEREVTGLIFALAGYLVHDLYEDVPFMLLDSLEAIDSERIASLVDYFSGYADHLVVALLPEDAQALSDDYARVESI
ncbi:archaea-specific SMC-related protein [Haloarcula marina]|uniref:archaea-specific SMC-related protein n=1 Tax=Haloarcula marina TaxID=2961574 RepID=UPI0020B7E4BD|nr:archaea-specific SMC-related protein [Halomicroarcula marina]